MIKIWSRLSNQTFSNIFFNYLLKYYRKKIFASNFNKKQNNKYDYKIIAVNTKSLIESKWLHIYWYHHLHLWWTIIVWIHSIFLYCRLTFKSAPNDFNCSVSLVHWTMRPMEELKGTDTLPDLVSLFSQNLPKNEKYFVQLSSSFHHIAL